MQFFGWFEDNKFIYFAMEYVENGNLYELLEKGNILESDMKVITKQLLAGLQVMHKNNFCHRDIKPEVVLFIRYQLDRRLNPGIEHSCSLIVAHCSQNRRLWHLETNNSRHRIGNGGRGQ